eukprot:gene327-429_t
MVGLNEANADSRTPRISFAALFSHTENKAAKISYKNMSKTMENIARDDDTSMEATSICADGASSRTLYSASAPELTPLLSGEPDRIHRKKSLEGQEKSLLRVPDSLDSHESSLTEDEILRIKAALELLKAELAATPSRTSVLHQMAKLKKFLNSMVGKFDP